jgi:predicted nucleotide-binding protein
MSELYEELLEIANRLERWTQAGEAPDVKEPLKRLKEAATTIGKAWSGSWLGYHARVYFHNLQPTPPGAHFSQEWGLTGFWETKAGWREFDGDELEKAIYELASNPDLNRAKEVADNAAKAFEDEKPEILSLLSIALAEREDAFLTQLRSAIEKTEVPSKADIIRGWRPSGTFMSRDTLAMTQGLHIPPHISVLSLVIALKQPPNACVRLAQFARRAGSHLARRQRRSRRADEIGTDVFIGHGKSPIWRELKDFIQDRLHLPWDEFNRVPVAGVPNIARLSEMLDAAAIALLVMTGDDEQSDGKLHARMNVVHEAGLFQGRLSFTRAIVLLEEGCEEFSNIHGLGQIRFPKGNMKAAFDEVRLYSGDIIPISLTDDGIYDRIWAWLECRG